MSDLVRNSRDASRGIFFQELFRVLYHAPLIIEESLRSDVDFMAFYSILVTLFAIRKGLEHHPGAALFIIDVLKIIAFLS